VAEDYYAAMQSVERRMSLLGGEPEPITADGRAELLTEQLTQPEVTEYSFVKMPLLD